MVQGYQGVRVKWNLVRVVTLTVHGPKSHGVEERYGGIAAQGPRDGWMDDKTCWSRFFFSLLPNLLCMDEFLASSLRSRGTRRQWPQHELKSVIYWFSYGVRGGEREGHDRARGLKS